MKRVAVVTGSNQGIGYGIVKVLAKEFDGVTYLTARNEERGKKAVEELAKEGLKVNFHQLDIDDVESIKKLAAHLKQTYGGLDLLVNNAAIAFKQADTTPFAIQARETIRVNYTALLNVCDALFPLLRPHARVVNVSSRAGLLKTIKDEKIRARLVDENLTIDEITKIMNDFVEAAQNGTHEKTATSAYGVSKVGVTAATRVQQRMFNKDQREDLIVNACCPGYVSTNMSSYKGTKTIEEGAITPLYLALLPANVDGPKGEFWAEKKPFNWEDLNWTWS